jgi:hypothetical protein
MVFADIVSVIPGVMEMDLRTRPSEETVRSGGGYRFLAYLGHRSVYLDPTLSWGGIVRYLFSQDEVENALQDMSFAIAGSGRMSEPVLMMAAPGALSRYGSIGGAPQHVVSASSLSSIMHPWTDGLVWGSVADHLSVHGSGAASVLIAPSLMSVLGGTPQHVSSTSSLFSITHPWTDELVLGSVADHLSVHSSGAAGALNERSLMSVLGGTPQNVSSASPLFSITHPWTDGLVWASVADHLSVHSSGAAGALNERSLMSVSGGTPQNVSSVSPLFSITHSWMDGLTRGSAANYLNMNNPGVANGLSARPSMVLGPGFFSSRVSRVDGGVGAQGRQVAGHWHERLERLASGASSLQITLNAADRFLVAAHARRLIKLRVDGKAIRREEDDLLYAQLHLAFETDDRTAYFILLVNLNCAAFFNKYLYAWFWSGAFRAGSRP